MLAGALRHCNKRRKAEIERPFMIRWRELHARRGELGAHGYLVKMKALDAEITAALKARGLA